VPTENFLKILFVLNPVAGGRSKAQWEETIHEYFKELPHKCEVYHTVGENDKESVKHWINTYKPDRVVAVGGDGTLKLVAEVTLGKNIPIGILPAGSANGMARELALPTDLEECLDIILNGNIVNIDIIRINDGDICLHLSDIGMNAQLVKYFEENGWRGKLGYARGVFRVLWNRKLLNLKIYTDEEVIERGAFMVVLANARMYGTGAMINPDGDLKDGKFEVIVIRRISFRETLKILLRNRNFNPEKIETLKAKSVEIYVRHRAFFQVDGEYKGKTKAIKAKIEKQVLPIMLKAEEEK
jgi:YegS/Rv2252/BmrU family lipid kinase